MPYWMRLCVMPLIYGPGSALEAPSTLSRYRAPPGHMEARAAPTRPRAPSGRLDGPPWPRPRARGRLQRRRLSTCDPQAGRAAAARLGCGAAARGVGARRAAARPLGGSSAAAAGLMLAGPGTSAAAAGRRARDDHHALRMFALFMNGHSGDAWSCDYSGRRLAISGHRWAPRYCVKQLLSRGLVPL